MLVGYLAGGMHPVIGSVVAGPDSQFSTEIEGLMANMDDGLQEMTESVEHMMQALTTSPRVQAAAKPQVQAMLKDPALQEEVLRVVRDMQMTLHGLRTLLDEPETRAQLLAHARALQEKVEEVAQGLDGAEEAPRRLSAAFLPALRGVPRAGAPQMVTGEASRQANYDLYGTYPGAQAVQPGVIKSGDFGTTFPLGVYDPLNLIKGDATKYRRWQEMEIKHGRIAMAATVHVLVTEAGYRWPGYLSDGTFGGEPIKFADMPGGTLASWAAMPPLGWAQIIAFVAALDSAQLQQGLPESLSWNRWQFAQDPNRAPGDVASQDPEIFTRYSDPAIREFKLNAERNNGRAAMMGIIGMMIHEALTGNPLFPLQPEAVTSVTGAWWLDK
jgi:light-harvesting complex I chlorophyll a/b binding protein 1